MKHYHSINSARKTRKAKADSSANQTQNQTVAWVHVSPGQKVFVNTPKAVIADSNSVIQVSLPDYYSDNLAGSSDNTISLEDGERSAITRNLLAGAIAAAKYEEIQRIVEPPKTANLSLGKS